MEPPARYELDDGVATITMDDGKVNALSPAMLAAVDGALDRAAAEADPEARAELLAEAERAALGHLAVLPIGQFVTHVAVADHVRDLETRPGATFDATRVWLAVDER